MGLDMYLKKKIYVGAKYEHRNVTGRVSLKIDGKPLKVNQKKVSEIVEEVGYWRKANQIHNWFVKNVQDGEDDCGEYSVSIDQLEELLNICKEVKKSSTLVDGAITNGYKYENGVKMPIVEEGKEIVNPEVAEDLLPTGSGFFFGSTDYDQYYMSDIDHTIAIIEAIIKEDNSDGYCYQSSW